MGLGSRIFMIGIDLLMGEAYAIEGDASKRIFYSTGRNNDPALVTGNDYEFDSGRLVQRDTNRSAAELLSSEVLIIRDLRTRLGDSDLVEHFSAKAF